ncbi:MAG: hypothetical protein WAZ18_07385 [Alphaproteobacteria bacterium]
MSFYDQFGMRDIPIRAISYNYFPNGDDYYPNGEELSISLDESKLRVIHSEGIPSEVNIESTRITFIRRNAKNVSYVGSVEIDSAYLNIVVRVDSLPQVSKNSIIWLSFETERHSSFGEKEHASNGIPSDATIDLIKHGSLKLNIVHFYFSIVGVS